MEKKEIFPIFEKERDSFKKVFLKFNVILSYLFGSMVRGDVKRFSDIDIAVLLDKRVKRGDFLDIKLKLETELFDILKKDVDVVILNEASIVLKYEVIKYGKVIFKLSEKVRVSFETEVLICYLDTKYVRDESLRYMLRRIEDGNAGEVFRPKFTDKKT